MTTGPDSTDELAAGLDLHGLLDQLAAERPVFHSEADLQHALAWQLHLLAPALTIRLERRPDPAVRQAADVWITDPAGASLVLELKYLVRATDVTVARERFVLANQGAHDISRYDVIKDLTRVEGWVRARLAARGAVILLSNHPGYWRPSDRTTIDAAFRLHHGRQLTGELAWADHAGAGTTRGRTAQLRVHGAYDVAWRSYATLPDGSELRALVLDTATSRQPVTPPPGAPLAVDVAPPEVAPPDVAHAEQARAPSADGERRTARQEILEVARELTARGLAPFSPQDVIAELRRRGSSYPESTIRTHIVSAMCVNAPVNHGVTYPDLRRVGRGRYVLTVEAESG